MKKTWILVTAALLIAAVAGGYAVLDRIFPRAEPINAPAAESITAVTLAQDHGSSLAVKTADFGEILKRITEAVPTRTMSVNDYPTAKTYYTIEIHTEAARERYFVYAENAQVYIEIPYEGIYKSNRQFLDFIEAYFVS